MKIYLYLAILLSSMIYSSCRKQHNVEEAKAELENVIEAKNTLAPELAKEVNRYEFVEGELLKHPEDEKEFNHRYMGSMDEYDYISVRSNRYKIPSDQLDLKHQFQLTDDPTKWVNIRIHFSHIKYR